MPAPAKILAALDGKPAGMSIPDLRARVDGESRGEFGAALRALVDRREVEVDISTEQVTARRAGQ